MNELDLFAAAVAADPHEREALLNCECASQPALRSRIDQLLKAHFKSHPLLDQAAHDGAGGPALPIDCLPREVVLRHATGQGGEIWPTGEK